MNTTCIAALARYRKSRAGQLGHAPGDAYDITKDHKWLFDWQGQGKKDLCLWHYAGAAPWRRTVTPGTTVVVVVVVVVVDVVVVVVAAAAAAVAVAVAVVVVVVVAAVVVVVAAVVVVAVVVVAAAVVVVAVGVNVAVVVMLLCFQCVVLEPASRYGCPDCVRVSLCSWKLDCKVASRTVQRLVLVMGQRSCKYEAHQCTLTTITNLPISWVVPFPVIVEMKV